jgi:hypothetical protein
VRNRALHDALRAFAERAAEHLALALENGAEIPFEVAQQTARAPAVLYRYRSLSDRFVRDRFAELQKVDGYRAAVLALSKVEATAAYVRLLEEGEVPPGDRRRAETALRGFLARTWEDVTAFEWDDERFERAYSELESVLYESSVIAVVVAPLFGLRLGADRMDLGFGLELARADATDAPREALAAAEEGHSRASAVAIFTGEVAPKDPPPLTTARIELGKLLTAFRLFKAGAVACGSTGWWRLDDGAWRSMPIGVSGRSRAGEYRLDAAEQEQMAQLFALVRTGPPAGGPLPWAMARFEMGCEQSVVTDGLSDHLLALRALLDGDHSGAAGVAPRLAALCADPEQRPALQDRIEQAFTLERQLMRGRLDADLLALTTTESPDTIALELEDNLRAILRDTVCGYLTGDLERVADELLLAGDQLEIERSEAGAEAEQDGKAEQELDEPDDDEEDEDEEIEPEEDEEDEDEDGERELVGGTPDDRSGDPEPAPEFVVRERPGRKRKAQQRRSGRWRRTAEEEPEGDEAERDPEQETQEWAAVGSRAGALAEDVLDWGFDDDPSDYSGAV